MKTLKRALMGMGFFHSVQKIIGSLFLLGLILIPFQAVSQALKNPTNRADVIMICPDCFREHLTNLVKLRESQGYTIKVVTLDSLYAEFKDTLSQDEAIRDFISYTLEFWEEPVPQAVLLAGGVPFIPAHLSITQKEIRDSCFQDTVAIDEWFVVNRYQEDLVPDAALGRLPARNVESLSVMISKIITYETILPDCLPETDFLFLADSDPFSSMHPFERCVEKFKSEVLPSETMSIRIDIREDSPYHGELDDLIDAVNQGVLCFSYYGHGNSEIWSHSYFLTSNGLDSLAIYGNSFFLSTVACDQYFHDPNKLCILEKWLSMNESGAVATLASTGENVLSLLTTFINHFYQNLIEDPMMTIGESFLSAKYHLITSFGNNPFLSRITLLGDPCMRIPFRHLSDIPSHPQQIPQCDQYVLLQNYPNPFNGSTQIRYILKNDAHVKIKVLDVLGREMCTLVNDYQTAGDYRVRFNPENLSTGVYFYCLEADVFHTWRKLIYNR